MIWKTEWDGEIIYSHCNSQARGVAILFKQDLPFHMHDQTIDDEGRYIVLDVEINGFRLTLCNLYAPNNDEPQFYLDLFEKIESYPNDDRIMGGDWNLVLDVNFDKKGGINRTNINAQTVVKNYMEETELVDIWRFHHPTDFKFTWYRINPTKISCRLDFFLVNYGLTEKITSSSIGAGFRTDHSTVSIKFLPFNNPRGKGFWKLNCSLLGNLDYVKKIKEQIQFITEINAGSEPRLLWDTLKASIRGESIKFSSNRKRIMNKRHEELEKDILELENKINITTETAELIEQLELKQQELNNLIKIKTTGAFIRSRMQNAQEHEKSSTYFFNLEKRTANLKSINRLETGNTITENPDEILEMMKQYYEKLYTSANTKNSDNYINSLNKPEDIKPEHIDAMENEITEEELLKIIKMLPNNKSPGEDGLPSEFYKVFWIDIKVILLKSYQASYENDKLSLTQRRGILSLIPKKSDPLKLKNWRPISLLNQDYKILAKLIAERIKLALPYLIDIDQTGFIKGRFIGQNIINIIDLMNYTEENDIAALLMSIDYEKAFDKLEWGFIQKSLTYFNFPPVIKKWIAILYTDITSCVTNNGWASPYFPLQRGVRQGCPLSPYLFIIASELLAIKIRQNPKIKGIKLGNKEHKIKLYADDTQIFVLFEEESFKELVSTIIIFSNISGLKVNFDKSNILRIGAIKNTDVKIKSTVNFEWTNEDIKILGITITTDLKNLPAINMDPLLTKIDNIVKIWKARKLTLFGKALIINSLLVSQLIYRLTVLPTPDENKLKSIDKTLFNFLWDSKPHRITKRNIYNFKGKGGLKMIDINLKNISVKSSWIKRIIDAPKYTICPLMDMYCKIDIPILLRCNIRYEDVHHAFTKQPPAFWQNILQSWCAYNFRESVEIQSPIYEIIWFNSNIRVNNQVVFHKYMYNKGIVQVKDLIKENGSFYTYEELRTHYRLTANINFLEYYSITQAIRHVFKEKLIQHSQNTLTKLDKVMNKEKVSKYIYNSMLTASTTFPEKAWAFHNRSLSINMSREVYISSFELMYESLSTTKLIDFQFRLLHNIITTNIQLKQWGLKDDDKCTFCNSQPETTIHLFLKCNFSGNIWNELYDYIARHSGTRISLADTEIMLGVRDKPFASFYNTITTITKQYIYACRCKQTNPTF